MVGYGQLADFLRTVCGLQGRRSVPGGLGRCLGTGGLADPRCGPHISGAPALDQRRLARRRTAAA